MTILFGIISAVLFFIVVSRWVRKPLENAPQDYFDDFTPPKPDELQLTESGVERIFPSMKIEGENLMVFYNGLLMSSGIGTLMAECNTVNDPVYFALIESCNEYFVFELDSSKPKDRLTIIKSKNESELFFQKIVDDLKRRYT